MSGDLGLVLDGIQDPFVVLDSEWSFSYLNPAAAVILGGDITVGERIWERFPDTVGSEVNILLQHAMENSEAVEFIVKPQEFGFDSDGWFNIRAYPVSGGLAVIAWDATRARAEQEEREELDRARHKVAKVLQQALLPPALPKVPGVEVGASYLAAGEGVEVGGDFYDVFAIENDGWAFVIGDVTGKGPEAAALTSLARYSIRAAAMRVKRPVKVLGQLNEEILRQTDGERLFTAVFAELEPDLGTLGNVVLRVACAGHPSPLLVSPEMTVELLEDTGTILGAVGDPEISSREVELAPGSAVVFYTDGVTESRRGDGLLFGLDRLVEVLSGCSGASAEEMAIAVQVAATEFHGGALEDDAAVLVLRVDGR